MMRNAFIILCVSAAAFLLVDLREIIDRNEEIAAPALPAPGTSPVLPPALTEGVPEQPPGEIVTKPEILSAAMTFDLGPGGILMARGTIDPGAAARFATEVAARGEYVKSISLDSPGGSIDDALAMSAEIRTRKLDTRVENGALCASSCPILLAGGTKRLAGETSVVGVHQVYNGSAERPTADEAMASAQTVTARVGRHLEAMGIKPGLWLHALETPPDRLYYLTPKEMTELALTTGPLDKPTAKKK